MPTGSGLGGLLPVVMTLAGIVALVRARARARRGNPPDADFERRREAAAEMERRMASYLAGRDSGGP